MARKPADSRVFHPYPYEDTKYIYPFKNPGLSLMAKFRSHYSRNSKGSSSFLFRLIVYGIVLIVLLLYLARYFKSAKWLDQGSQKQEMNIYGDSTLGASVNYLPAVSASGELIHHKYFSLSYSERHEQAEWVAYELTVEELNAPKQERFDYFSPDLKIRSRSALHRDYTGSGYTRGHLAPAADMAFDPVAARECFYMSNISPQVKAFNNGIWRELEECVRDWARKNKKLYIITGPVLKEPGAHKIGDSRVSVPRFFYKVILDNMDPERKGIAFLIPNEKSDQPLGIYATSIDSIEHLTAINFFGSLDQQDRIESIEKNYNLDAWPMSEVRFAMRRNKWNKQE